MHLELPDEVVELEKAARRVAADVLRPGAREAAATGAWTEPMREAFESLGTRALPLPSEAGGDANALAAVVALEALAWGDAGGLLLADQPGPASLALAALPAGTAGSLAAACLEGQGRVGVLVAGDLEATGWMPGSEPPDAVIVAASTALAVGQRGALDAEETGLGAFEASAGTSVRVRGEGTLRIFAAEAGRTFEARAGVRLWASAVLCGIGQAALDYAIDYGRERVVFGAPVLGHQANAFDVAAAATGLEAVRTALRTAAGRYDASPPGERVDAAWLATLAYLEARQAALCATDLGVQLLGGHGYITDHPAEKWWREARALVHLFGGADAATDDLADRVLDAPDPLVV